MVELALFLLLELMDFMQQTISNDYGQCNVPTDVTTSIQVAATGDHTVALQPDGSVRCWGTGSVDTCSNPNYGQSIVPPDLGLVDQVAAEGYSTMALRHDGTVRCWGYNKYGECNVPTDLVDVIHIAGGGHHNVAISAIDQAIQWRVEDGGNGHWYALRSLPDRSWQSGVAIAQSLGGHLGTITSASEQSWVCAAALSTGAFEGPDGPFLGGYKNDAGALTWITNEKVDYLGWGPGEPNGGLSERYVHLKLYGEQPAWNDCPSPYATSFVVEWDADCNSDGIVDYGQILNGQLADTNTNGIPDCCEPGNSCCVGDIYVNHIIDGGDLGVLLSEWGAVTPTTNSDLNRDGFVNGADLGMLLANWGPCGG